MAQANHTSGKENNQQFPPLISQWYKMGGRVSWGSCRIAVPAGDSREAPDRLSCSDFLTATILLFCPPARRVQASESGTSTVRRAATSR
jgi:hypothetical protein